MRVFPQWLKDRLRNTKNFIRETEGMKHLWWAKISCSHFMCHQRWFGGNFSSLIEASGHYIRVYISFWPALVTPKRTARSFAIPRDGSMCNICTQTFYPPTLFHCRNWLELMEQKCKTLNKFWLLCSNSQKTDQTKYIYILHIYILLYEKLIEFFQMMNLELNLPHMN